jgi:hypothetical protein
MSEGALRKMFGSRENVTRGLRTLRWKEFISSFLRLLLLRWLNQRMGDLINWYDVLVGIPQEMRLLETHNRRWDDNIEMVNKNYGFREMNVFQCVDQ